MASNAPDLRNGRPAVSPIHSLATSRRASRKPTSSGVYVSLQRRNSGSHSPGGGVAKWDGDKLMFWASAKIYPQRAACRGRWHRPVEDSLHRQHNGARSAAAWRCRGSILDRLHREDDGQASQADAQKDHELAFPQVKPQNIVMFKVGAKKNGLITAVHRTFHVNIGVNDTAGGGQVSG
jgi:hypothetical protein